MFTRAQVIVPYPRVLVFDVLLYACKESKARVKKSDKSLYRIDGKSPTTPFRFGQKIRIVLDDVSSGTNIKIYENGLYVQDPRFINSLLKSVSKRIPFNSQVKIDSVKDIEGGINIVSNSPNPLFATPSSISSGCEPQN